MATSPPSSKPLTANFASDRIVFSAGAAIFHLATARVVICHHPGSGVYFLPKGRKNAGPESLPTAAIREGFEESGYRCRLLPLPIEHIQPPEDYDKEAERFVVEPVWTQMMPFDGGTEYVLLWFVAETLDAADEESATKAAFAAVSAEMVPGVVMTGDELRVKADKRFVLPEPWPEGMTLKRRVEQDRIHGGIVEPTRHLATGMDEDERTYEARLVSIREALRLLNGSVMADVVRKGWEAVQLRERMEESGDKGEWEDV